MKLIACTRFGGLRIHGLRIIGHFEGRREKTAFRVSLLSFHHPRKLCWSWFVEFYRDRQPSPFPRFFRCSHVSGHQEKLYVDLFWLGTLLFCVQHHTAVDRRNDARRSLFAQWLKAK